MQEKSLKKFLIIIENFNEQERKRIKNFILSQSNESSIEGNWMFFLTTTSFKTLYEKLHEFYYCGKEGKMALIPVTSIPSPKVFIGENHEKNKEVTDKNPSEINEYVTSSLAQDVDKILEKIYMFGIGSITDVEQSILDAYAKHS